MGGRKDLGRDDTVQIIYVVEDKTDKFFTIWIVANSMWGRQIIYKYLKSAMI
jgi:hypothetical protein